ncbi:zinc finger protein 836-like [Ischnura elegans]|uniref:zinc finger protein 836-like n=1 Tax=Ischnura elegans TaxID=197161 RepID=UPI001ED8B6E9|nr:zinc finger protein 836-like [Ischnura elegans]
MDPMFDPRICRLCLGGTSTLFDVFEENLRGFCVNEAIKDLLQIEVENEVGLFWLLCLTCLEKLGNFHLFKLQCIQSNDSYKSRFTSMEKEETDCARKKRSGRAGKVSQSDNNVSSPVNKEGGCGDVLMELSSRDGLYENIFHNLRDELGVFDLVSEIGKDGDWSEIVEKELSQNGDDNIDIEKMVVPIKMENIEFEHDICPREFLGCIEGSESQMNGMDRGDSWARNERDLERMDKRAEMMHNNNHSTENVDPKARSKKKRAKAKFLSIEEKILVIEEHLSSKRSPRELSKRYGVGIRTIHRLLKAKEEIWEMWKTKKRVSDSSGKKCLRESQNQTNINVKTKTNVRNKNRKPMHSTMKKRVSKSQNQVDVRKDTVLASDSSESHADGVLGTSDEEENELDSYDCDICGKQFLRKCRLINHLKCHATKKAPKCKNCGLQFLDMIALFQHDCLFLERPNSKKCVGDESLSSVYGQGSRIIESALAIKTSQRPYECAVCGEGFRKCKDLEEHVQMHKDNKDFVCDLCMKPHSLKEELIAHLKEVHGKSSAKQKRCGVCGKKYLMRHFKRHLRVHYKEKRYDCNDCGRRFWDRWRLMDHAKEHWLDGHYRCIFCPKSFSKSGDFKEHMLVHSGDKPYICPTCGERFSYSRSMKRHWLNHQDLKLHECDVCHRKFFDLGKLKSHSKLHTKEKAL